MSLVSAVGFAFLDSCEGFPCVEHGEFVLKVELLVQQRYPNMPVLLTSTTHILKLRLQRCDLSVFVRYYPIDLSFILISQLLYLLGKHTSHFTEELVLMLGDF